MVQLKYLKVLKERTRAVSSDAKDISVKVSDDIETATSDI